jgi:hypothetical protein
MGLIFNAVGFGVGWGLFKGSQKALEKRVDALETEIGAVGDLKVAMAEVKTAMTFFGDQLKELNTAIAWMRKPAEYDIPGVVTPKRGG